MKLARAAARAARAVVGPRLDELVVRRRLREKTSPATKLALRSLQTTYRGMAAQGQALPSFRDVGFGVFSEHDEDGLILFLLGVLGSGTRRFVDIGAGDGIHASNCANLAFNLGFDGVFVDADERLVELGRTIYDRHRDTRGKPPRFVRAFVKTSNVDSILGEAGIGGEVDVLSIDVDGNDYWIWEALTISPRIVVIETHDEYGLEDVLAPYDENYSWRAAQPGAPIGASPLAMTKLATRLGYRLVAGNRRGFNAVYLREDLAPDMIPEIGVEELLDVDRSRGRVDVSGVGAPE